jgi:hypothetical protein
MCQHRWTPRACSSRALSSSTEAPAAAEAPAAPLATSPADAAPPTLLSRLEDSSALSSGALALAGSRFVCLSRRRRPLSSPRSGAGSEASVGVLRALGGGDRGGRLDDLEANVGRNSTVLPAQRVGRKMSKSLTNQQHFGSSERPSSGVTPNLVLGDLGSAPLLPYNPL